MNVRLRVVRVTVFTALCVMAAPGIIHAQQFVCWPIVRGDTASGLALQLTGTATMVYSEAFQIRDPARRMFVPKSHYARLTTRWQACVARDLLARAAMAPASNALLQRAASYDISLVWRVGLVVTLTLFACSVVVRYVPDPAVPPDLQHIGEEFVNAFARPLIDPGSGVAPIRARLRFVRHTQQLEICIAPNDGRRYPNLLDHKRNVEYDVVRVARLLGTRIVVGDRLRAEGNWVVIPIRRIDVTEAGAR